MAAPLLTVRVVEGRQVELLGRRVKDQTGALERVGQYLVHMNQVGFVDQAFGGAGPKWALRRVPNLAGALRDLGKGAAIQAQRFQPRPALVESGSLRAAIHYAVLGRNRVEVRVAGQAATYGARQQAGAPNTIPVTPAARRNLKTYLKAHPADRKHFGFLFRRKTITVTPVARRFLGIPDWAVPRIRDLLDAHLRGVEEKKGMTR